MFAAHLLHAARSSFGKSKNISHDLKCFARCNRSISNSQQHASRTVILSNNTKNSIDGGPHNSFWWALGSRFRSLGLNRFGNSQRWASNSDNSQQALYALMGANFGVFLLWRADTGLALRNFTTSWAAVKAGRVHTLVTAAFSQRDTMHLASNMIGLFFFGREVARTLGGRGLITLYLVGGIFGNLVYVTGQALQDRGSRHDYYDRSYFYNPNSSTPALGSSGSVNSIVIFECLMAPMATVLIYGIIPLPAIALGAMYLWFDVQGALGHGKSGVGYTTHLGGAAIGALAYLGVRRGRIPTRWR